MTVTGKVDLRALPQHDSALLQSAIVAPATTVEKELVAIVAELLNLDVATISIEANFFDLGGHSLLVVKMINEIRTRFVSTHDLITIKQVFNGHDLKSISGAIDLALIKQRNDHSEQKLQGYESLYEGEI